MKGLWQSFVRYLAKEEIKKIKKQILDDKIIPLTNENLELEAENNALSIEIDNLTEELGELQEELEYRA